MFTIHTRFECTCRLIFRFDFSFPIRELLWIMLSGVLTREWSGVKRLPRKCDETFDFLIRLSFALSLDPSHELQVDPRNRRENGDALNWSQRISWCICSSTALRCCESRPPPVVHEDNDVDPSHLSDGPPAHGQGHAARCLCCAESGRDRHRLFFLRARKWYPGRARQKMVALPACKWDFAVVANCTKLFYPLFRWDLQYLASRR